ncbi:hypothetical protein L1987_03749 [Smallanthus sonchifolius]|uniref:Uncharacterized protein n=1 Tax=Smallanthus sonchifolius TaxID=185202 RepID=A0ACB9KBG4_9ASTR|nr:hypothetical protein L1987_03749 [Smallanthus sonchifolius]
MRRVTDQIRGSYEETLTILELMSYQAPTRLAFTAILGVTLSQPSPIPLEIAALKILVGAFTRPSAAGAVTASETKAVYVIKKKG